MVCAAGFTNARLRSHGYAQTASPAYLASIINRGASALAADGRIGPELAEALKAEARRRASAHACARLTSDQQITAGVQIGGLVRVRHDQE